MSGKRSIADGAKWFFVIMLMGLVMIGSFHAQSRVCDEIYVVGEGETLHTISDKCGDPFIFEQNPQINDHDDVFPGLVIKITPTKEFSTRKFLK
ncbi:hypothetical protein LguiA_010329 [Lonicera macranthoides]